MRKFSTAWLILSLISLCVFNVEMLGVCLTLFVNLVAAVLTYLSNHPESTDKQ